jgi:hypothetical protein
MSRSFSRYRSRRHFIHEEEVVEINGIMKANFEARDIPSPCGNAAGAMMQQKQLHVE